MLAGSGLEAVLRVGGTIITGWWHLAFAIEGLDLGLGALLTVVAWREIRRPPEKEREAPALSVLISAYDEAESIVETLAAVRAQEGVELEILVGDDGSTDGTADVVEAAYPDGVRVYRFAHGGKGATLNALASHARHPVLITLDGDGVPTRGALAAMARAFADPAVDAAAGMITVRNGRASWLLRHQSGEYQRTSAMRIGWSVLGGLEQLPGAFTGVRADRFAAAGGFTEDSLTEDYELVYRLLDRARATGKPPLVVTVPAAQVLTDGPRTLGGFIGQRTRWFAGFLTTLARFPWLVFDARLGTFGLVRLPLKVVDAFVPLLTIVTVLGVLRHGVSPMFSHAALLLLAVRWAWSLVLYALSDRLARRLGDPAATRAAHPPSPLGWLAAATELVTYLWLRQIATLRAYVWALRRLRTWEASRHRGRPKEPAP